MKTHFDITKLILHKTNFLSKKECDMLIDFSESNKEQKVREQCPHAETGIDQVSGYGWG